MGDVIERAENALDELSTYDAAPLWPIVAELVAELKAARAENELSVGRIRHIREISQCCLDRDPRNSDRAWLADSVLNILNGNADGQ